MAKFPTIYFLLLALFICQGVFAQGYIGLDNAVLWKIDGNKLSQPSYLFGTIHLIEKSEFELNKQVLQTLYQTDVLVLEIDLNLSLDQKIQMTRQMMLPQGKSIDVYMVNDDFVQFRSYALDTLGIKEAKFNRYIRFKPIGIYSFLVAESMKKTKSYEQELMKKAKRNYIDIVGLETIEFQMSIFDSIPIDEQMDLFFSEDIRGGMDELTALYKSQDIDAMASMIETDEYSVYQDKLLAMRNKDWVEKLPAMLSDQSLFIAVGAAHLGGENGLIKELRSIGYTLTPIFFN